MAGNNYTFESKLLFLLEIFSNPPEPGNVLRDSIEHKLGRSLEQYEADLHVSELVLENNNTIKVLTRLNKENK